jgi:U3 small nucleolar RNA-associated protein 19
MYKTVSVFTLDQQPGNLGIYKQGFLQLLDLSLRSAKIPSKVVAAFVKRLARLIITEGHCNTQNDKMYVLSFIANILKRHPRCIRLLHRTKKIYKE